MASWSNDGGAELYPSTVNNDSVAHESFNWLSFVTVFLTVSDTLILPHREQSYWPEAFVSVSPWRCESL